MPRLRLGGTSVWSANFYSRLASTNRPFKSSQSLSCNTVNMVEKNYFSCPKQERSLREKISWS